MLDKFGEVQALPLEAPSPPFGRRGTTTGPPRTPLEHSLSSMDDLTMPAMKLFTIKAMVTFPSLASFAETASSSLEKLTYRSATVFIIQYPH